MCEVEDEGYDEGEEREVFHGLNATSWTTCLAALRFLVVVGERKVAVE